MAYLLINAASYNGEILHTDMRDGYLQDSAGFEVYRGRRYENRPNDIFQQTYLNVGQQFTVMTPIG